MSFRNIRLIVCASLLLFLSILCIYTSSSFAHIFSDTPGAEFKEFGKYTVAFLPVPADPQPNKTAVLNLNIQENGIDVRNVFASVEITDNDSGNVISEFPSRLYEVADLFFPQNFTESGNYVVTLTANVRGDPQYGDSPIVADFEMYVGRTVDVNLIIIQSVIVIILIVAILVIMHKLKKRQDRQNQFSE